MDSRAAKGSRKGSRSTSTRAQPSAGQRRAARGGGVGCTHHVVQHAGDLVRGVAQHAQLAHLHLHPPAPRAMCQAMRCVMHSIMQLVCCMHPHACIAPAPQQPWLAAGGCRAERGACCTGGCRAEHGACCTGGCRAALATAAQACPGPLHAGGRPDDDVIIRVRCRMGREHRESGREIG